MNNPNWKTDLSKKTASHSCGLVVRFTDGLIYPKPTIGCHCSVQGRGDSAHISVGEWTGLVDDDQIAINAALSIKPEIQDLDEFLGSLMKQAGDVWAEAKKAEFIQNYEDNE